MKNLLQSGQPSSEERSGFCKLLTIQPLPGHAQGALFSNQASDTPHRAPFQTFPLGYRASLRGQPLEVCVVFEKCHAGRASHPTMMCRHPTSSPAGASFPLFMVVVVPIMVAVSPAHRHLAFRSTCLVLNAKSVRRGTLPTELGSEPAKLSIGRWDRRTKPLRPSSPSRRSTTEFFVDSRESSPRFHQVAPPLSTKGAVLTAFR